ncbi:hypothetical protein [Domibacillus iocasae]|uniref:Uncharacterized protein n=1 Tax=Domibacillus iocasae TaxID=1714016 RepID=A0A1E7DPE2_9BACI|nr:hypothetical protein [Domibacillus iocasae]OES44957.1 hypothetical protein BA724_06755 [Domibacillus iocasae]
MDRIMQVLAEWETEVQADGFQAAAAEVTNFEQRIIGHAPCLEFQMYNKEQDIFYARVWNTWLKR